VDQDVKPSADGLARQTELIDRLKIPLVKCSCGALAPVNNSSNIKFPPVVTLPPEAMFQTLTLKLQVSLPVETTQAGDPGVIFKPLVLLTIFD